MNSREDSYVDVLPRYLRPVPAMYLVANAISPSLASHSQHLMAE